MTTLVAVDPEQAAVGPERLLWLAVLQLAILEARGAGPYRAQAWAWLTSSMHAGEFAEVCALAGLSASWVRARLPRAVPPSPPTEAP